ncbi:YceI family protein [Algicella marina]|uniref:Lipid/polyisoprenoid-binding YceI-like domain-containing protein n=1 Tax=Algicella marina TaxID=2683284 RepID=A0A6P1T512_9RHOB|nr:YceI family protein [Algicella marina]QHQ37107.1 hypothetical protein GO499_18935 [Algicella marina]
MRLTLAILAFALSIGSAISATSAHAETWRIDTERTKISTSVEYLGRAKVDVRFPRFNAALRFDPQNLDATRAELAIATGAVQTSVPVATPLVRSADFLDTSRHPEMRFRLTRLVKTSPSTADISGNITMLGVTRPVKLKADVTAYGPSASNPDVTEAAFRLTGRIDRRDFGNNTGFPQVAAELPLDIRLVMTTKP